MSNAQHYLAKRVSHVTDNGVVRKIRATERLILRELADDAAGRPCCSDLTIAELAERCGCSARMAQYGITVLQANGHITRKGSPGVRATTIVHVGKSPV